MEPRRTSAFENGLIIVCLIVHGISGGKADGREKMERITGKCIFLLNLGITNCIRLTLSSAIDIILLRENATIYNFP